MTLLLSLYSGPPSRSDFSQYLSILFYLILVIVIIAVIFSLNKRTHHSNWNTLIDNFKYSSKDFYKLLRAELWSHGIEDIKISGVNFKESHLFSSNRLYLEVKWKGIEYYVCAAPFGAGFFISWWMFSNKSSFQKIISGIPFIGSFLERNFFPDTFHVYDTSSMFMTYVQSSVLKVIDDITKEQGIKGLSELERKPVMQDLFRR
jgi:hypothetical protein